jgi:Tol biopolymer transport system component
LSWSPDGSRIAYAAGGRIYVLTPGESGPSAVAQGTNASWSPDGRTIAYLAGCDVRVTTPDGLEDRSIVDLTTQPGAARCDGAVGLVWSPDGTELAAMVDRNLATPRVPSTRGLFLVAADGSRATLLGGWTVWTQVDGIAWRPVP